MFSWIAGVVRRLWREMVGFGAVGVVGVVCDVVTFNVLIAGFHAPKVYASLSGNAFGTLLSYLGNRYWVFRKRDLRRSAAEVSLFVAVSLIAILITAACVAFNEYVLGFRTLLEANIAQFVVGQGLGSIFRFWGMHTFVFPEARGHAPEEELRAASANAHSSGPADGPGSGTDGGSPAGAAGAEGLQTVGQLSETE